MWCGVVWCGVVWCDLAYTCTQGYPYIEAEVEQGVREYTRSIKDFVSLRIRLAYVNVHAAKAVVPVVGKLMAAQVRLRHHGRFRAQSARERVQCGTSCFLLHCLHQDVNDSAGRIVWSRLLFVACTCYMIGNVHQLGWTDVERARQEKDALDHIAEFGGPIPSTGPTINLHSPNQVGQNAVNYLYLLSD